MRLTKEHNKLSLEKAGSSNMNGRSSAAGVAKYGLTGSTASSTTAAQLLTALEKQFIAISRINTAYALATVTNFFSGRGSQMMQYEVYNLIKARREGNPLRDALDASGIRQPTKPADDGSRASRAQLNSIDYVVNLIMLMYEIRTKVMAQNRRHTYLEIWGCLSMMGTQIGLANRLFMAEVQNMFGIQFSEWVDGPDMFIIPPYTKIKGRMAKYVLIACLDNRSKSNVCGAWLMSIKMNKEMLEVIILALTMATENNGAMLELGIEPANKFYRFLVGHNPLKNVAAVQGSAYKIEFVGN
jgi:hypothetical protein